MFWSLELEPGKRYGKVIDNPIQLTAAIIDPTTGNDAIVQVKVELEGNKALLCNLSKKLNILQVPLDVEFVEGDEVIFTTEGGTAKVHLVGHMEPNMDETFAEGDEEEEEEESEEEDEDIDTEELDHLEAPDLVNGKRKRSKVETPSAKKAKVDRGKPTHRANESNEDSGDDDDDDFNPGTPSAQMNGVVAAPTTDAKRSPKRRRKPKKHSQSPGVPQNQASQPKSPKQENLKPQTPKALQKSPHQQQKSPNPQQQSQTPQSKKKKNQQQSHQHPSQEMKPKSPNPANAAVNGQTNTPKKKKKRNRKRSSGGTPNVGNTKMMTKTGIIMEDLKVGSGGEARQGHTVGIMYEGRILFNNKVFEKSQEGEIHHMKLESGDEVRGLVDGIVGMKIGGIRKITCPQSMAFGTKGSLMKVPPKAAVFYKIKLANVK